MPEVLSLEDVDYLTAVDLDKVSGAPDQANVKIQVSNFRNLLPSGPRGDKLYVGNGPPTALNTPDALPGDEYIDVDTGDLYTLN
jgi:hypothetical protein